MITDKELKSGLRKCKGHKYETLRFIHDGKGYLKCPRCFGHIEVPEEGLEQDFDVSFGKMKQGDKTWKTISFNGEI